MLLCLEYPAHNGTIIQKMDKIHHLLILFTIQTMSHSFIRTLYRQKRWACLTASASPYCKMLGLKLKIADTSDIKLLFY